MARSGKTSGGRSTGFKRADSLLSGQIRDASASRGFAQSRLLTHWAEIAGTSVATMSRPVEVTYGRGEFGATLVLLTTGANAPMLEMQKEKLREKVNAVYGYNAISRIRITQTAASGFSEGRVAFSHAPNSVAADTEPPKAARERAAQDVTDVQDGGLRAALELLGANIISRSES